VVGRDGAGGIRTGGKEEGECGRGSERARSTHRFVLHRAAVPLVYIRR